eukprot:10273537-Alexandrium_andersonii.AAC.1
MGGQAPPTGSPDVLARCIAPASRAPGLRPALQHCACARPLRWPICGSQMAMGHPLTARCATAAYARATC